VSERPDRFRTGGVSLRRRVAVAFLAVGVLGVVALAFTVLTFNGLLDARSRVLGRLDPAVLAGRDLRSALLNQDSGVRGYALAADERFLEPYTRGRVDETAAVAHLQEAIGHDPRPCDVDRMTALTSITNLLTRLPQARPRGSRP